MKEIMLILQREFMTRIRKKAFIITTLLSPLFFAAVVILPSYLASLDVTDVRKIAVVDNTGNFTNAIPSTEYIKIAYLNDTPAEKVKNNLEEAGYYALLVIDSAQNNQANPLLTLYSQKQPSIDVLQHIENTLDKVIETRKLKEYNIDNLDKILENVKTDVQVRTMNVSKSGEEKESNTLVTMGLAYILSFLMYMMVLIMGTQIMQGVIEEKSNRVVEVIVSSVKPFKMMVGKILGMASVSLLQIFVWVVLTVGLASVGINLFMDKTSTAQMEQLQQVSQGTDNAQVAQQVEATQQMSDPNNFLAALQNQNFPLIIGGFIFYFLMGFLLYAAMFAAVGSAVESVTDTQQLTLPITLPLILSIIVMISGIKSPDGPLAFWFSIIPFTSPIVMLTRLPFGVPTWQLALSASLLVITFFIIVWIAAKIYRVGILMYGKKYTWKEMIKWISYKG